jgi:hypothetical protein
LLISASKDITVHEMCPLNWLSGKELVHWWMQHKCWDKMLGAWEVTLQTKIAGLVNCTTLPRSKKSSVINWSVGYEHRSLTLETKNCIEKKKVVLPAGHRPGFNYLGANSHSYISFSTYDQQYPPFSGQVLTLLLLSSLGYTKTNTNLHKT